MPARPDTSLKRILESEGRTQAWLARTLGVDAALMNRYVHGVHVPNRSTQEAIASALGRPVGQVFPDAPSLLRVALEEEGRNSGWLAVQLSARFRRPIYRQQISSWVRGTATPEPEMQLVIAELLGRSLDELFVDHGSDHPTNPLDADGSSSANEAAA